MLDTRPFADVHIVFFREAVVNPLYQAVSRSASPCHVFESWAQFSVCTLR